MDENERRHPAPVLNKRDMTERWNRGEFGNKIRVWPSIKEFLDDEDLPQDTFTLRSYEPGSPHCAYDLTPRQLRDRCFVLACDGVDMSQFYVNESASLDDKLLLQGEVCRSHRGLELRCSTVKKKMRLAFAKRVEDIHGLRANIILKCAMDPVAYDWVMELLDRYPDHVVEFSTWSVPFGDLGWNTIVWEVRKY